MLLRTQMEIVRDIVFAAGSEGIRTETVKIQAMWQKCSCPDRFLRYLAEPKNGLSPEIISYKKKGDRTKTWFARKFAPPELSGTLF